jgi:hypothetical protein
VYVCACVCACGCVVVCMCASGSPLVNGHRMSSIRVAACSIPAVGVRDGK